MRTIALLLTGLLAGGALAAPIKLTAENTKIEFKGTKADGSHVGGFKQVSGTVDAGGPPEASKLKVEIAVDSLYTDDTKLTNHLKTPDFFDVRKHPKATFSTTGIKAAAGKYTVTGDLTLHGVTKKVEFPATIAAGADGFKLDATFKIQREDFGMTYGKGKVDNDVTLTVKVDAK